ncbi:hypothetical protein B7R74_13880 [Yersinia pseudotuberculosis]|uniref:Putative Rhs accessory genetic element n=1 Tax=Yersinia pseudotuberculosis TaxID=633 RepID=A0A380QDK7_YERPU|nr:hypothetical protein [Yersinia pseudotuberculosis]PSH19017.1 hypothetical protein B7R74_13880 [Yersinia pseudotuberculosis]SUP86186.1 putative Rhs accessory genetic element [Yersinia pseudotuberculosis]
MLSTDKEATGLRFTLNVGDLPPETFAVASFTLHEQFSTVFALDLEVASANPNVGFGDVLDNIATLTIWRGMAVPGSLRHWILATGFTRLNLSVGERTLTCARRHCKTT